MFQYYIVNPKKVNIHSFIHSAFQRSTKVDIELVMLATLQHSSIHISNKHKFKWYTNEYHHM